MSTERLNIIISQSGAPEVRRDIEQIGTAATRSQGFVGLLTRALGGLATAALFTSQIRSSFAFRDALAEVSTLISGDVGPEMQRLTTFVFDQSATFGSLPVQTTKAFYQAISAGAEDAAAANDLLTAANKLAIGGVTDLFTATDGLTSVLNAYGPAAGGATAVTDSMFVAMRAGKTTIGELASSLGAVTPIAASLGVSFDEVTAAVAALTKGGISTNVAVTGLRAILASVAKPTEEAKEAAAALGLQFNTTALQSQGLQRFLADVVEKTDGNVAALAKLFGGVEALVPVLSLAGGAGEDFIEIMAQMEEKAGATEGAFTKMANSPGFQLNRVFASFVVEMNKLVDGLTDRLVPALRWVADHMGDLVRGAQAALVALTAITSPYILSRIAALGLALATATRSFRAIIAVVTVVITFLVAFSDQLQATVNGMATVEDYFVATWSVIRTQIDNFLTWFRDNFGWIFDYADEVFGDVEWSFRGVLEVAAKITDGIVGVFVGAFNAIRRAWELFPSVMTKIFVDALQGAVDVVQSGVQEIANIINSIFEAVDLDAPFGEIRLGNIMDEEAYKNLAARVGSGFGTSLREAFNEGFEGANFAKDFLSRIDTLAEEQVIIRIGRSRTEMRNAALTPPPTVQTVPEELTTPVLPTLGGEAGGGTSFAELLRSLQQEGEVLRANVAEREKVSKILELENSLKRRLTETERSYVEQLVDENMELRARNQFAEVVQDIERETAALTLSTRARHLYQQAGDLQKQMLRSLTDEEFRQLDVLLQQQDILRARADIMDRLTGASEVYATQQAALNQLLQQGLITLGQYNVLLAQAQGTLAQNSLAVTFGEGFVQQLQIMRGETANVMADLGAQIADVFGPGGVLQRGVGDAISQILVYGASGREAINQLAKSILGNLISSLVQVGIQMALNALLAQTLGAATTAAAAAMAAPVAAAWAPAAAFASLATLGGNAAPAAAAVTGTVALTESLALGSAVLGFREGGWTGDGSPREAAGVVHNREFVLEGNRANSYIPWLNGINEYREGGLAILDRVSEPPRNGDIVFRDGGWTGNGSDRDVAGIVHNREFVVNARATREYLPILSRINAGERITDLTGYREGGLVNSSLIERTEVRPVHVGAPSYYEEGDVNVSIINNAPGVEFETRQIGPREVEVIASRIVREQAPDVIASDMQNPNSRTSKSLSRFTKTERRR